MRSPAAGCREANDKHNTNVDQTFDFREMQL